MPKPVYLCGDTPLILLGLESALKESGYLVRKLCIELNYSFAECNDAYPFCLIIQLAKDPESRIRIIQQFLKRFPNVQVLLISEAKNQKCIQAFFKAGIKGVALPSIQPDNLCNALQGLEQNKPFVDPKLSQLLTQSALGLDSPEQSLTRREKQVLQLIVEEYTTKEIAQKLYISNCTAETHRLNIIHKLGVRNTAGVVREAIRLGWYA